MHVDQFSSTCSTRRLGPPRAGLNGTGVLGVDSNDQGQNSAFRWHTNFREQALQSVVSVQAIFLAKCRNSLSKA